MTRSPTFSIAHRPVKRDKDRPWVVLMDAHPKPLTIGRCETEDEARDKADRLTGHYAAQRTAALLDGFGES